MKTQESKYHEKQVPCFSRTEDELRGVFPLSFKRSLSAQRGAAALEYTLVLSVLIAFAPIYFSNLQFKKTFSIVSYTLTDGGTEGKEDPVVGKQGGSSNSDSPEPVGTKDDPRY
ncbi:MAG: hypothetical protein KDD66_05425 [Bdellovibrionales bacterium]|nr:hypothetical protein [Bdellovibrionales bacterium]